MYVSLTFDDGYILFYEIARQLYKLDALATFYIITGLKQWQGVKLLTSKPELIRKIREFGHEVGSHTHTHRPLPKLSPQEIELECMASISFLNSVLKDNGVYGIAYPYGAFDAKTINVIRRYFVYGRTMGTINRWNEMLNPYIIGSMGLRHLVELPLVVTRTKGRIKLVVLTFHNRELECKLLKPLIELLETFNAKVLPLREALKKLNVI